MPRLLATLVFHGVMSTIKTFNIKNFHTVKLQIIMKTEKKMLLTKEKLI